LNVKGTFEKMEPLHAGKSGGHSVWFGWIAPGDGIATFSTAGSSFDTLLAVYTNLNNGIADIREVVSDDDSGVFFTSRVKFNARAGEEFAIAIDGFGGAMGDIMLGWNFMPGSTVPTIITQPQSQTVPLNALTIFSVVAAGAPPLSYQWFQNSNALTETTAKLNVTALAPDTYSVRVTDGNGLSITSAPAVLEISDNSRALTTDKMLDALEEFASLGGQSFRSSRARGLVSVSAGSAISHTVNNSGSTTEQDEPPIAGIIGGASRWQQIVVESDGVLRIDTLGSEIDTLLAVYQGDSFANLLLKAEDDNSAGDGRSSLVSFPVSAGQGFLVAVDGVGGQQGKIQINYLIGELPALEAGESVRTATNGVGALFHVEAQSALSLQYQWQFEGIDLLDETNAMFSIPDSPGVQSDDVGEYTVLVSNPVGFVSRTTVLQTNGPVPVFTTRPSSQYALVGSNCTFSAMAEATEPVSYQWYFKKKPIKGATNPTLELANLKTSQSGQYGILARTSSGATGAIVTLAVLKPIVITKDPVDRIVAEGKSATFKVSAKGSLLHYHWQKDGISIPNATSKTLKVTDVSSSDVGQYWVIVSNPLGSVTSHVASLSLKVVRIASPVVAVSSSFSLAAPSPLSLSIDATGPSEFQLSVSGLPGEIFALETSPDLTQWSRFGSFTNETGTFRLQVPIDARQPRRFYRALLP
jgi:hypothetical protein